MKAELDFLNRPREAGEEHDTLINKVRKLTAKAERPWEPKISRNATDGATAMAIAEASARASALAAADKAEKEAAAKVRSTGTDRNAL